MTYISNTIMLIEEEIAGNLSNKLNSKIQDKQIWKSLRTHILSRREQNKQAEADAEVLRKKKRVEYQKMQENKLSLAQINGRLSQLRDKRDELEEEKRVLLNQTKTTDDTSQPTALIVPKSESNCELGIKSLVTNNTSNTILSNHRQAPPLLQKQQSHIYRQQITTNAQSGAASPVASSGLRPLSQQSLIMHNSNTKNTGNGNQTLLVCSPAAINAVAANNQNSTVTCLSTSLAASLSSTISYTKFSSLYNSTSHLLPPNIGNSNKMGRTPSPQTQPYQQQQMVVPYSAPINKYQSMNCGMNNVHSAVTTPVVNSLNQALTTVTNSNFPKNSHPNVSNYGSFYQPNSTEAVNYCVNNGMSSLSPSISSVNTVYSYSGPPHARTESSGNLLVSGSSDHATLQIPKPVSSHHYNHGLSHPPLYMSPGIRNQTSVNHPYHPKPPHGAYSDEKLVSTTPNFYQPQNNRNIYSSNTTTVSSLPHQMSQKPHNIGYPMRHSTPSPASQLSPAPSNTSSYNGPTSSVSGYSNKSSVAISISDVSRYQPSSQIQMSRHD